MENQNEALLLELLEGKEQTFPYEIDGLKKPLQVRPLTYNEMKQLKAIEKQGQKGKANIKQGMSRKKIKDQIQNIEQELNYEAIERNSTEIVATAIKLSTGVSEEVLNRLDPSIPKDLFLFIMDKSNITGDDVSCIKSFRPDE